MSFNLLLARTFGLLKSTEKLESAYESLLADYTMFCEFVNSGGKKEYHELDVLVHSATFKQKKHELQHLTLKGSKEAAQLTELKRLEHNHHLQKFYETLNSDDLKRFEKITATDLPSKYQKLKSLVESPSFDAKKKKNEQSEEYKQITEYHRLKSSDDIQFLEHFKKSAAYKNYLEIKDSPERKELEDLRAIVASDEFKSRVAYLEDPQKWEKSEEYAKQKRLAEMQKLPETINYLKYEKSNAFDFFKKWNLVFEDRFNSGKLDGEKWLTLSHWANQTLGQNFSQPGDLHAFTDGKNVSVDGKTLRIELRRENAKGMQWRIPFGFVEQDFDYTTGIVSTAGIDWWKNGILEAKVKYSPDSNLVDVIYLLGEENSPQINLLEMGARNRVGILSKSSDGINAECGSISGLKPGEYYIFKLEWSAHSLVWKVNERVVFTLNHNIPAFKMHLNAASILVTEGGNLPHRFEIDWVRFYQHAKE